MNPVEVEESALLRQERPATPQPYGALPLIVITRGLPEADETAARTAERRPAHQAIASSMPAPWTGWPRNLVHVGKVLRRDVVSTAPEGGRRQTRHECHRLMPNCSDVSIRTVGALAGGEAESAEISSDTPTADVTPTSAKP